MKICNNCKLFKPLSEFYKSKREKDGLQSWCKECTITRVKEFNKTEDGKISQSKACKKYYLTEKGKIARNKSNNKYKISNPEKRKVHSIIEHALRDGKLIKKPCEVCYTTVKVEAHHDDYSKPLDIKWLCRKDHKLVHRILKILKELGYTYSNEHWNRHDQ